LNNRFSEKKEVAMGNDMETSGVRLLASVCIVSNNSDAKICNFFGIAKYDSFIRCKIISLRNILFIRIKNFIFVA
jgi:hypothetical protein